MKGVTPEIGAVYRDDKGNTGKIVDIFLQVDDCGVPVGTMVRYAVIGESTDRFVLLSTMRLMDLEKVEGAAA